MTPFQLQLLLHFHSICEPHPQENSIAGNDAIKFFMEKGLITRDEDDKLWVLTECGYHFILMLIKTPLPLRTWIDPRTKEVI